MSLPQRLSIVILALMFSLLGSSLHAASAAGAGIEVDGKYVGGYTITSDGETRVDLVRQLAERPITFERGYKIPVDAQEPKRAMLKGRIRLISKLRGGREVVVTAKVLELVEREGKWFVKPESLKRALNSGKAEPGGNEPVAVTNKDVMAAAEFAVAAQAKGLGDKEPVELKLVRILSAQQQVVAGMNYRLKLRVKLDGEEKEAEAVVWWQSWRKPDPYRLTSWTWEKKPRKAE